MIKELAEDARPFKTHLNMLKPFHETYVLPLRTLKVNEPTEAELEMDKTRRRNPPRNKRINRT
jgi:hypothetical protein